MCTSLAVCACCCAKDAACCGLAATRRCGACRRHTSTFAYLSLIVLSVAVAGVLKFSVAPLLVVDDDAGSLFYAVSDCATRVGAWAHNRSADRDLADQDLIALCVGNYFVFRVSFALTAFFLFTTLATACGPLFHNGQWVSKVVVYVVFLVGAFFVPNDVFYGFSYFARIMSFLFILLQMVILVDFAFDWHEDFQLKFEQLEDAQTNGGGDDGDGRRVKVCCVPCGLGGARVCYLAISFVLIAGAITGSALLYIFYEGCDANVAIVTMTLLFGLVAVITGPIQCGGGHKDDDDSGYDGSIGLLVPAVVFCTCVYYAFTSVKNNPDPSCNPTKTAEGNNDAGAIVLGLLVSAFSLSWVSLRTAQNARGVLSTESDEPGANQIRQEKKTKKKKNKQKKKQTAKKQHAGANELDGDGDVEAGGPARSSGAAGAAGVEAMEIEMDDEDGGGAETEEETEDEVQTQNKMVWLFHAILMCGALYLAMVMTKWGDYTGHTSEENEANQSTALWVNAVGGWVAFALFAWIRVAPSCCPSRDFNDVRAGF